MVLAVAQAKLLSRQKDAAIAAQANLHPEDGHSFRVFECPGPEEVPAQLKSSTVELKDFTQLSTSSVLFDCPSQPCLPPPFLEGGVCVFLISAPWHENKKK